MELHRILNQPDTTLATVMTQAFNAHAEQTALMFADGNVVSYQSLANLAYSVATGIDTGARIGILASRSISAYSSILGAVLKGASYVPLNPRVPASRMAYILDQADCKAIVVGEECAENLEALLQIAGTLNILCPDPGPELERLKSQHPLHNWRFLGSKQSTKIESCAFPPSQEAYVLFTSGTTGAPKGIMISHSNVVAYLANIFRSYEIGPGDRVSQIFDISFDVSVHDIFFALVAGATLCIIPEDAVLAPAKYIRQYQLTAWHSVPSVPMFMDKFRMLNPDAFPSIRLSFFAGEALPARTAMLWRQATPNSKLVSMYGPTETTIVMTEFPWRNDSDAEQFENGIAPLGQPFVDAKCRVLDPQGKSVLDGEAGELYIGGPQVALGYINNAKLNREKFVELDDDGAKWFRSGDLVKKTKFGYEFLGRIDDQIQLRGFRVELVEIDRAIRAAANNDLAVAVPLGLNSGRAENVIAVVEGENNKELRRAILAYCKEALPDYMVPGKVKFVEKMPLNINGKIDRKALMQLFDVA